MNRDSKLHKICRCNTEGMCIGDIHYTVSTNDTLCNQVCTSEGKIYWKLIHINGLDHPVTCQTCLTKSIGWAE